MRIIAGSVRGARLGPVPPGVRPVSDRAREGLFSSLGDRVLDAEVLDLFAGTGALGIEALSRGADRATFVESERREHPRSPSSIRRIRRPWRTSNGLSTCWATSGRVSDLGRSRLRGPSGM